VASRIARLERSTRRSRFAVVSVMSPVYYET
jgi:hypothetical protein